MKKPYRNRKPHGCNCNQNTATATVMVNKRDYDVMIGKALLLDNVKALMEKGEKYTALNVLEILFKK